MGRAAVFNYFSQSPVGAEVFQHLFEQVTAGYAGLEFACDFDFQCLGQLDPAFAEHKYRHDVAAHADAVGAESAECAYVGVGMETEDARFDMAFFNQQLVSDAAAANIVKIFSPYFLAVIRKLRSTLACSSSL